MSSNKKVKLKFLHRKVLIVLFVVVFAGIGYWLLNNSHAINADINNDSKIDIFDLSILLTNYGRTNASYSQGNINGDTVVDINDLNILLTSWPGATMVSGIIVSPTGNDTTGNGTANNPYKTMNKAQLAATAGSNVYLRAGVYNMSLSLTKSGTSTAPITYSSYPGETAILDGTGTNITSGTSIIDVTGSYINVQNFEFRNSAGRAISFKGATNSSVKNSKMHDTQYKAISASGSNILIEGNEVWNATMVNANNAMGGASGWPQATGTIAPATNITFKNNYIHDSWGEGIDLIDTTNSVVTSNKVVNCYSVLIYLDDSHDIQITNNYVAVTDSKYNRNFNGNPATGFSMASENNHTNITNIILANNLVAGGVNKGIGYSGGSTTSYGSIKIYYNTIKGTKAAGINIDSAPSPTGGNEIKNNIVFNTGGGSLNIGNMSLWTIDHNDWPSGIPPGANGAGTLFSDPQLVNPTVGGMDDGYKVGDSSPVIGKATSISGITTDYFGTARISTPTMGFFEPTTVNLLPYKASGNSDSLPSNVIFDDEFNGTSLDLTKWQPNWLAGNDTAKTKPSNSAMLDCEDPAQVSESGGYLTLALVQKSCTDNGNKTYTYTSGLINSRGPSTTSPRFAFKSGYAEAMMYLPPGTGACYNWPGFWTDGVDNGVSWPVFLESDVMECLGGTPVATVHAGPSSGTDTWKKTIGNIGNQSGWHRFAYNFQPSSAISCSGSTPDAVRLNYYYDGTRLGSPYDVCMKNTGQYLIFQNDIENSSVQNVPNSAKVDYVRVWQ